MARWEDRKTGKKEGVKRKEGMKSSLHGFDAGSVLILQQLFCYGSSRIPQDVEHDLHWPLNSIQHHLVMRFSFWFDLLRKVLAL